MSLNEDYEYPTEGQYWKPIDLATHFNFSKIYVQILCKTGRIPAIKDGTRWRIPAEEVEKMIKRGSILSPKPSNADRIEIEVPPDKVGLVFPSNQGEPPGEKSSWLRNTFGI